MTDSTPAANLAPSADAQNVAPADNTAQTPEPTKPEPIKEVGGRKGLDPVRYGDWELKGRCIDF